MTRRELLAAGGLALVGRLLPSFAGSGEDDGAAAEIAMRSAGGGARVWFDPIGLRVAPGTTVRWVAVAGVHTTTAYHPANGDVPRRIPQGARPWDSGYLTEPGSTFEATLDVEGVHDFFCRPHEAAGMVGRIVVSDAGEPVEALGSEIGPPGHHDRLPDAALEALPSVGTILRRGRVPVRERGG